MSDTGEIPDKSSPAAGFGFSKEALLDQLQNAVIAGDRRGRIQYWNRRAGAMLDLTRARSLSLLMLGNCLAKDPRSLRREVFSSVKREGRWEGELTLLDREGGMRVVWLAATCLQDASGACSGYLAVLTDMTERKRADQAAEAALAESEERFRQLAENIREVFWIVDIEPHRLVYASPAYERVWGRSIEELYADPEAWLKSIHDQDRPRVVEAVRARRARGQYDETYRVLRPDGTLRWIRDRGFVVKDARGAVYRVVGIAEDITESLQAVQALSDSEERYRQFFAAESDALYVFELSTLRIVDANPAALELYGYSREEMLSLRVLDLSAEPERTVDAIRENKMQVARRLHKNKNGVTFPVEARAARFSMRGRAFGLAANRDISARLKADEELRLSRDQFHEAQKMEAVGRLAGGVAHDFNNILTAIRGYCDLLLGSLAADDARREDVAEIRNAGERAATLTRQLLAFSRRQLLRPCVLEPDAVLKALAPMLRRLIGEDIDLVLESAPGAGRILADRGQVEQVVMNLAVNARDAMPDGGRLTLRLADASFDADAARLRDLKPGDYVAISVSDTGVGMDEAVQARLFEPFFTTKELGKGTGLGLSMVYGIVKQSGGGIAVASAPGRGTTFTLYFPMTREPLPAPEAEQDGEAPPRGKETILLVEDGAVVRGLAQRGLSSLGYTVLEAADGEAALRLAASCAGKIDLMITDVVMPGLNGKELSRRLAESHPETKVIFTSGYTDDVLGRSGVLDPGLAFLQKPYSPGDLARLARKTLDAPNGHAAKDLSR